MNIQSMLEGVGATSFDFAVSETEAVALALVRPPDLITSDVKLVTGTGPAAVARIHAHLGEMPVIFISATPGECHPCSPPGVVLAKPFRESDLQNAFRRMV